MEEYSDLKLLSNDVTEYRNCVRDCYATCFLSDRFYRTVRKIRKMKLERNKLNKRKQEKLVKYAGRIGYYTERAAKLVNHDAYTCFFQESVAARPANEFHNKFPHS